MEALSVLDEAGFAEVPSVHCTRRCRLRAGGLQKSPRSSCLPTALGDVQSARTGRGGVLPRGAVAVQCTLFDKSADKNWLVALHQDLSIPVPERVTHPDCSGWSEKEG